MTTGQAYTEIVAFMREREPEWTPAIRRAFRVIEGKAETLRIKREHRRAKSTCICEQGTRAPYLPTCTACWTTHAPFVLTRAVTLSRPLTQARRDAIRELLSWAITRKAGHEFLSEMETVKLLHHHCLYGQDTVFDHATAPARAPQPV